MSKKQLNSIVAILNAHFNKMKVSKAGFSLRWLAGHLNVSPSHLSQILNGNRSLQPGQLKDFCHYLDIDPETENFLETEILKQQGWDEMPLSALKGKALTLEGYRKLWHSRSSKDLGELNSWKHFAILDATLLRGFDGSSEYLADRLSLDLEEVEEIISILKDKNLIEDDKDGIPRKAHTLLEFQSNKPKEQLLELHKEFLSLALSELENTDELSRSRRYITSATLTCSEEQLNLFKLKVSNLIKELLDDGANSVAEEVCQISLAFFPYTKK